MRGSLEQATRQLARRQRQARALVASSGVRGGAAHVLAALSRKLERPMLITGIDNADVLAVDPGRLCSARFTPAAANEPLIVNWIMSPPSPGSGGHTTIFRLVRHLQAKGHTCRIYLYDFYRGDFEHYRSIVQGTYTDADTEVADIRKGMKPCHASFATSWETAYVLAAQPSPGKCLYLVQDLESLFYPASSAAILAENTYSFGFHGITAGRWLPTILGERYGMTAEGFDFGSDVDLYTRQGRQRSGVAFFARPSAPRRAFELGVMALEVFAKLHPETTIHCYGDSVVGMPFPFVNHGHVTPAELNQIYNECFAGLSLSMTNVSLVPHEMLASGCIPVVNDAPHNRVVLDNPHVRYSAPNPHDLARALSRVVAEPEFEELSSLAAASVAGESWEAAGAVVEAVLRRLLTPTGAVEGTVP